MIAEVKWRYLLFIFAGIGASYVALGQSVLQRFDERQVRASQLNFRWSYSEVKRLEATTDAPAGAKGPARPLRPGRSTISFAAGLEIARKGDTLVAQSEYPIFMAERDEPYRARLVSLRAPDWVGEVRYDREGVRQDEPYITEFAATALGGTKTISPLTPSTLLWPQAFVFFAGESPRGLYGIEWRVVSTSGNRVILEGHNYDPSHKPINALFKNQWDFKLVVDAQKAIPLDFRSSENGLPREHTEVLESKRIEGIWVPSRVQSSFTLGGAKRVLSETQTTWKLDEVKPTGNLKLPIPLHSPIGDYRLESPDLHPWLFPPPGAQPVQYRWDGRVPSLDELRSIQSGHPRPAKSEGASIWLFGGPFALAAAAGMMLIYRKRLAR